MGHATRERKIDIRDGELTLQRTPQFKGETLEEALRFAEERDLSMEGISMEPVHIQGEEWTDTETSTRIKAVIYLATRRDRELKAQDETAVVTSSYVLLQGPRDEKYNIYTYNLTA